MLDLSAGHRYASDSFLLVGGESIWQEVLGKLLENHGHCVLASTYGEPALRAARVFDPDVVIISLASNKAACDTARRLRDLPIGDMYTLIAMGDGIGWPSADFDVVLDEIQSYSGLMEALREMDEAWTVRVPVLEQKSA